MKKRSTLLAASALVLGITTAPATFAVTPDASATGAPCGALDIACKAQQTEFTSSNDDGGALDIASRARASQ